MQFKLSNKIQNKQINVQWKTKRQSKREQTRVLRGLANCAYIHASKLTGFEDFTKQASKVSTTLTNYF